MPHDKFGALVQVGDRVTMEFTVESVTTSETHCNLGVRAVEPMPGTDSPTVFRSINTRQVVKLASSPQES